jgi:hypothetical protein
MILLGSDLTHLDLITAAVPGSSRCGGFFFSGRKGARRWDNRAKKHWERVAQFGCPTLRKLLNIKNRVGPARGTTLIPPSLSGSAFGA